MTARRVAFAGTPEFAASVLAALMAAGHEITLVLTQPDRPAGRGLKPQACAVKQLAQAHGLPVIQPRSLRRDGRYPQEAQAAQAALQWAAPEVLVVVAYGLILPAWVLALPPLGGLNVHASLLPRWRGAAPIQRAIEAGDTQTGVCIMQMDEGLDTGAVRHRVALPIEPQDTTQSLHDRLAQAGAQALVHTLAHWADCPPVPQAFEGVCYAHKIDKAEGLIDWQQSALAMERRIRAFDPAPGCQAIWQNERYKIWRAKVGPVPAATPALTPLQPAPGTIVAMSAEGLDVACGQGTQPLRILELQRPGGKRMPVADFLNGCRLQLGDVAMPDPNESSATKPSPSNA